MPVHEPRLLSACWAWAAAFFLSGGLLPHSARASAPIPATTMASTSPKPAAASAPEFASLEGETQRLDTSLIRIGELQAGIFLLQLIAFVVQAVKLHQTMEVARQQGGALTTSLEHTARSAAAMETVAAAMRTNAETTTELLQLQKDVFEKNLRAYLTPQLGAVVPEDREEDNRHEVRTVIKNAGNTPARAIFVTARLRVLPHPLPADADLSLPPTPAQPTFDGMLPAHETFYTRNWLEGFLSDAENVAIRELDGSALYIYGVVRYTDIFNRQRETRFCYMIGWDSRGNGLWRAVSGRNEST
jgi:hypothetical protein